MSGNKILSPFRNEDRIYYGLFFVYELYKYIVRTAYLCYLFTMIRSFKNKETEAIYKGKRVKKFDSFKAQAERRLLILDSATRLEDLMLLPSNKFKAMTGDREGQYSIRINKQWRVCFEWHEDGPHNVEITDPH